MFASINLVYVAVLSFISIRTLWRVLSVLCICTDSFLAPCIRAKASAIRRQLADWNYLCKTERHLRRRRCLMLAWFFCCCRAPFMTHDDTEESTTSSCNIWERGKLQPFDNNKHDRTSRFTIFVPRLRKERTRFSRFNTFAHSYTGKFVFNRLRHKQK